MLTRLSITLLLVSTHLRLGANMPSPPPPHPHQPATSIATQHRVSITKHGHAVLHPQPQPNARQKKGPTFITHHHQLFVPTNLHVIPVQYQNIHSHNQIPVISHAHTNHHHNQNQTTQLIPVYSYIPTLYNHWVPVHELTVIPLHRDVSVQKVAHYSASATERKNDNDDDDINRYRRFYGGYGSGLYFGGHGAGHGFHSYYG